MTETTAPTAPVFHCSGRDCADLLIEGEGNRDAHELVAHGGANLTRRAERPANTAADLIVLPQMCGRAGSAEWGDMNVDWECKRAAQIFHLHAAADDIRRSERRIPQLRSEWKRGNLTRWVSEAVERHNRIGANILADLPECTHLPETRRECTVEESLPACTCNN